MQSNLIRSYAPLAKIAAFVLMGLLAVANARSLYATEIFFDTEIVSLELSGGPFPLPLAGDSDNFLGDSIDGYGFVDSNVVFSMSSQNGGPASLGRTTASCAACPPPSGPGPQPITPDDLDGQTFVVDSFFDVFFDITVTDVDGRVGRDYVGQQDAASITFPGTGPSQWQSTHVAIFDKDAPNFGLFPPQKTDPFIGDFDIEIPLGVDVNENGIPDKIKFTLGTLSIGDENRTFIKLPDGTVINEFDAARFMEGAVVDESTDPPFTIGAQLPSGLPDPAVFGGPGSMTSNLLNPLTSQVPEPAAIAIFGLGLAGMVFMRRRRAA